MAATQLQGSSVIAGWIISEGTARLSGIHFVPPRLPSGPSPWRAFRDAPATNPCSLPGRWSGQTNHRRRTTRSISSCLHGPPFRSARCHRNNLRAGRFLFASQYAQHVKAIELDSLGRLLAPAAEKQCRKKFQRGKKLVGHSTCRQFAGPMSYERHPQTSLPHRRSFCSLEKERCHRFLHRHYPG